MPRHVSALSLFVQLELRCGIPRAYRQLLGKGWVDCFINDRRVVDIFAANALLQADSVQLERSAALQDRESPNCLKGVITPRPAHPVVHRPAEAPAFLPPACDTIDLVEPHLKATGSFLRMVLFARSNPTHSQVGGDHHFLALTAQQSAVGWDWMIVDLQSVSHPPLVPFWAPLRLPFTVSGFADELADAFPSLAEVVGAFIADSDLELSPPGEQAPFVMAIGLPRALPPQVAHQGHSAVQAFDALAPTAHTTTMAGPACHTTTTTGEGTAATDPAGNSTSSDALAVPSGLSHRPVAVFDTVRHVWLHHSTSLGLSGIVA